MSGRRINRWNMARNMLKQFIDKRPNDRVGLVVFGGQAYIASPLTLITISCRKTWTGWASAPSTPTRPPSATR